MIYFYQNHENDKCCHHITNDMSQKLYKCCPKLEKHSCGILKKSTNFQRTRHISHLIHLIWTQGDWRLKIGWKPNLSCIAFSINLISMFQAFVHHVHSFAKNRSVGFNSVLRWMSWVTASRLVILHNNFHCCVQCKFAKCSESLSRLPFLQLTKMRLNHHHPGIMVQLEFRFPWILWHRSWMRVNESANVFRNLLGTTGSGRVLIVSLFKFTKKACSRGLGIVVLLS